MDYKTIKNPVIKIKNEKFLDALFFFKKYYKHKRHLFRFVLLSYIDRRNAL